MEVMKQLRQRAIRDLVEQRPIRTQQELPPPSASRGFRATQATISRDVAELGLGKASREARPAYVLPPRLRDADVSGEDRLRRLLADVPVEFRGSPNLLLDHQDPCPGPHAPWRQPWIGPAGRRSSAPRRRRHRLRRHRGPGLAAPPPGSTGRARRKPLNRL